MRSMCGADAGCLAIQYQSLQGTGGREDGAGCRVQGGYKRAFGGRAQVS
jgi:hypothetical protein